MMNALNPLVSLAGIVVLAGGASKRMGTPKAELVLPTGERLLDYHVRHALELKAVNTNLPIMIADNGRGFEVDVKLMKSRPHSPVFHISDYIANESDEQIDTAGALTAIESAMQTLMAINSSEVTQVSLSSWLLVVSCDSLIPVTDLWCELQQVAVQAFDEKVICLTDEHHLYPLLGLYQLSIEPDLQAYIDSHQRRVIPFIKPIVQPVPFAKSWQHLTNFNTPEDFEQACVALSNL